MPLDKCLAETEVVIGSREGRVEKIYFQGTAYWFSK
jgi:hypothetical protein